VRSKRGRPSGRPTSRSSILGHPGASPEKAGTAFPPPPGPPSSTTALGCGGLLTLTLRGKAMDGFEEQQERNRPQLSPPSLENRRNGCRFPTSANRPAALRRVPLPRSFSSLRTEHTIDRPQTLATQSTRPPNRGRSTWPAVPACNDSHSSGPRSQRSAVSARSLRAYSAGSCSRSCFMMPKSSPARTDPMA